MKSLSYYKLECSSLITFLLSTSSMEVHKISSNFDSFLVKVIVL